jgi:hypothetical protein
MSAINAVHTNKYGLSLRLVIFGPQVSSLGEADMCECIFQLI